MDPVKGFIAKSSALKGHFVDTTSCPLLRRNNRTRHAKMTRWARSSPSPGQTTLPHYFVLSSRAKSCVNGVAKEVALPKSSQPEHTIRQ